MLPLLRLICGEQSGGCGESALVPSPRVKVNARQATRHGEIPLARCTSCRQR